MDWDKAPKPNLYWREIMVTVRWSVACLIHYSFLNSSETIRAEKYVQQIDEGHWKLQCLQPVLVNRMGLILLHHNVRPHVTKVEQIGLQFMLQKLNELGYKVLPHLPYSPDLSQPTTTSSSIWTIFCRENTSTTSRRQKMLSKSCSNREAWIFML